MMLNFRYNVERYCLLVLEGLKGAAMMQFTNEIDREQKVSKWQMLMNSKKSIVSLISILIIFAIIIFSNYHQTISAGSLTASQLEPVRRSEVGQVQDFEKMARSTDALATKPSIWPVSGEVTSGFGWRNSPWGGGSELHAGIDIANNLGTPIVATADGTVVRSEWSGGYGNVVQIDHGNGIETIYGHNSRIIVNAGHSVKKGQVIAYLGSTGRSTGPHVHYEVRVNGAAVDPVSFLVQY